jgi:subfamily B ATP-binding cassette protein MsbA
MEATEEEIIEAAQMAGIHEEVLAMPEGYNTIVGDRGVRLSMGQRQRIALARVFLRNPRILILDEPTASVDQKTEETLKEAFKKLLKSRTAIIITHRPSLMEMANRIFELKDGRLKEVK